MNEIFVVELSNREGQYRTLSLPATEYELLDVLDQLHMTLGENPEWEIIEHTDFEHLHEFLNGMRSLYELNEFAHRLEIMDRGQLAAFDGLFQIALKKREGPMSAADLFTYANSTDCCHVVGEALNDSQLGRFYAENGFIPELENVPDSIFELLDFEQLGRKARMAEGGIYTEFGYVVQHDSLKPVKEPTDIVPHVPEYAFRIHVAKYPFATNSCPAVFTPLELPATEEKMIEALEECGAASWDEVVFQVEDSAIPSLLEEMDCESVPRINELAHVVKHREGHGELSKFKAVLNAMQCNDIQTAIAIAEDLDAYIYEPEKRSAKDVALEDLRSTVGEPTLSLLLPHVYLEDYGMAIMESENAMMTPYGLVECRDGSMLLAPEDKPDQGGMQMQ